MGTGRIVEVYYHRKLLSKKNPLGGKKKMKVAGGCIVGIAEGKSIKYYGAGTVKLIPLSKTDLKAIGKTMKSRKKGKSRSGKPHRSFDLLDHLDRLAGL